MNEIYEVVDMYVQKIISYKEMAEAKGIQTGVYIGNGQVSLGGVNYPADLNNDICLYQGQSVYCILSNDMSKAVIIG